MHTTSALQGKYISVKLTSQSKPLFASFNDSLILVFFLEEVKTHSYWLIGERTKLQRRTQLHPTATLDGRLTRPISSSLREVSTWRFREQIARSKKTPALQANLNFAFCFSFSPNFEKRIWTSYFFFRFCITRWSSTSPWKKNISVIKNIALMLLQKRFINK